MSKFPKRILKVLCPIFVLVMLLSVCSAGISAATVSTTSVISTYTCDFEDTFPSNRTNSGELIDKQDNSYLDLVVKSSNDRYFFEIHNSSKGDLVLNEGKIYAVTIKYKVVRICEGDSKEELATAINLVRTTADRQASVKLKEFPNTKYYSGDTTDWVTVTTFFKASISGSPDYNRLGISVVSASCPDIESGTESRTTSILFDDITVTECTESTKSLEFVSNGGDYCDMILAQAGEAITLPTPTRDLYVFDGWYTDTSFKQPFKSTTMPNNMINRVYAKWIVADYAVTLSYNTGTDIVLENSVGRAGDPVELPVISRQGFNFAGWYNKEMTERCDFSKLPAENTTVYAKWEVIPIYCGFENTNDFPKPNNGTFTMRCILTSDDKAVGNTSMHYSFQRGFELSGSSSKGTPAGVILVDEYGQKIRLKSGSTYKISFKYKVVKYAGQGLITVIASDALGPWSDRAVQDCSQEYDASDIGKGWKNCTFTVEWTPKKDESNYLNIAIAGDSEIYVDDFLIYEVVDSNNVVGFKGSMLVLDSQGGSNVETIYGNVGDVITLPVPEKEGYRFLGWCHDPESVQVIQGETYTISKFYDKLYADWFKIQPVVEEEPQPQPEQEEPTVNDPPKDKEKDNTLLYIIIAAAGVAVVAAVVVVILVIRSKKKKEAE